MDYAEFRKMKGIASPERPKGRGGKPGPGKPPETPAETGGEGAEKRKRGKPPEKTGV
jgi:hypothetical protein